MSQIDAVQVLSLTVAEFKRLKRGVRLAATYGIPYDVVLDYAFAVIRHNRDHNDRMRFEKRA